MAFMPWATKPGVTVMLVLGIALFRMAYLLWWSPYSLIEDEAFYWQWSHHLQLSYSTKGPGISWAIWFSTQLFGDTELGVRMPAVVFAAIGALASAGLASEITRDWRSGFCAALVWHLTPIFIFTGIISTIDMPYTASWMVASWAASCAFKRGSWGAWIVLGISLASGFLFKYTMVLIVPGLVLAWFSLGRPRVAGGRLLVGVLVACLGAVPIVIYNAQHGWSTVLHLLGQLGVAGGDMPVDSTGAAGWTFRPVQILEYVGIQLAMGGPMVFLAVYSLWVGRKERSPWLGDMYYLMLVGVPIFVFYLLVSLLTRVEGNWPMAGFATLITLTGIGAVHAMDEYRGAIRQWRMTAHPRVKMGIFRKQPESWRQMTWHITIVLGLIVAMAMLRLDLVARLPGTSFLPVGRLTSARPMSESAALLLDQLRAEPRAGGKEPFVIAQHYGRAAVLRFYLPGQPVVYCSSSVMAGRHTDYDTWAETDLRDMDLLEGRPALVIGATGDQWARAFEAIKEIGPVEGDHKKGRVASFGFGYRGFDQAKSESESEGQP